MSNLFFPGGTTIYIRENGGQIEYSDNLFFWNSLSFPVTITNSNTSSGILKIEFITDITLTSINNYFICGSDNIQFGSKSLNNNGTRPAIRVSGVNSYPGLIGNGTNSSNGFNNIYVYNLNILAINFSTLANGSGWIGQSYFGRGSNNNNIINCSSNGAITSNGGGITGTYTGINSGTISIIGCNSSGNINSYAGGIVGFYAGQNSGSVTCEQCWSTGTIDIYGGGIFGYIAGTQGGLANAIKCYSTGNMISFFCGGIYALDAGSNGTANAIKCYSRGNMNTLSAGIFGSNAGSNNGVTSAINCYSSGLLATAGNGIYGSKVNGTEINCYVANNNWNDTNASSSLEGTPTGINKVGTNWVSYVINQPYELNNFGYTPYSTTIISNTSSLIQTYTLPIYIGQSSTAGIVSGNAYSILQKLGGDPGSYDTITIDSNTGIISTTTDTVVGNYTIYIRNEGSYNITVANLQITSIPCLTEDTVVLTPSGYINIRELNKGDLVMTDDNREARIKNVHKSVVRGNNKTYPCIVPKNSIGLNYPREEFRISQNHLIRYGDSWILPRMRFMLDDKIEMIKYYHIELENYITDNIVINNGIVVETYGACENESKRRMNIIEYNRRINTNKENRRNIIINLFSLVE